jgi:two-component system LytT family response regulator
MTENLKAPEKIRVVIVDDEFLARKGLRQQLAGAADVEIIAECNNGRDAVAVIKRENPDLVFLDVQMPELDGFGVLETVGLQQMPVVIFLTAYDEYALRAFEVHALDYLLKPIERERFMTALERARSQIKRENMSDLSRRLRRLIDEWELQQKYADRIIVKTAGRIMFLSVEEIDWIEAADNYVCLHVARNSHLLRETMSSLEKRLNPATFLRIQRSTIVNIERIRELQPVLNGEYQVMLRNGTKLTSGRGYRHNVLALLKQVS